MSARTAAITPQEKYLEFWTGGMNTLLYPTNVPESQYHWGENIINRCGIPQTRPGFDLLLTSAGTILQGFTVFKPNNGLPYLVVAIDGSIYASPYPFFELNKIEGINLLPETEFVAMTTAVKSVSRNDDGSLTVVPPYRILIIQDGSSPRAYWDGVNAGHVVPGPPTQGARAGLWMVWTASRLWSMDGSVIRVSDYGDPLTESENVYIAEKSNFDLPDVGTGMIEIPDKSGLLAFTNATTTLFKSSIRDRVQWNQTPDFQSIILPEVGCVAPRSPINMFGNVYWQSEGGLVSLDSALFSQRSSKIKVKDHEMMRSKRNVSPVEDRIACGRFENTLLVSVPSGSSYNSHTWLLDQSVSDQMNTESNPAWAGVWTGLRPVEWSRMKILGRERIFCAAYDQTLYNNTRIHIWEAMNDQRLDRGNRITCQFETREILPTGRFVKLHYVELDLIEILGTVRIKIYYAGIKGGYEEIQDTILQAEVGSIGGVKQQIITLDTILEGYKPQSRTVKSRQISGQDASTNNSCGIESDRPPYIDKAFSVLVEWRGRMAIRGVRLVYTPEPEKDQGECYPSEADEHNIVTDKGVGISHP